MKEVFETIKARRMASFIEKLPELQAKLRENTAY